jgi:anti-sigma B factor antagonist
MALDLVVHQVEGIDVVEVRGRVDTTTSPILATRLTDLINSGKSVLVDLRDMLYISSSGFRVLMRAAKLAEGVDGRLVLINLSSEVRRLFELGAFLDIFTISNTLPEGILACRAAGSA